MKTLPTLSLALLLVGTAVSSAHAAAATPAVQPALDATVAQPSSAPPNDAPPPAPQMVPAPPQQAPAQATTGQVQPPAASAGQWVFTTQYGWLWMGYGAQYASASGGVPYAYVYYPSTGWTWLAAPWVSGFGPRPYFGVYGAARFGWYRPGFYGPGYRAGFGYRPLYGGYHAAAGFHGPVAGRGFHGGFAGRGFGRR